MSPSLGPTLASLPGEQPAVGLKNPLRKRGEVGVEVQLATGTNTLERIRTLIEESSESCGRTTRASVECLSRAKDVVTQVGADDKFGLGTVNPESSQNLVDIPACPPRKCRASRG